MEYYITDKTDIQRVMYDHYRIFNGREVVKELGEPLYIEIGDTWIFDDKERGFICYNAHNSRVKYLYVFYVFRKFGVGSMFVSMLPEQQFTTMATIKSVGIFLKKGFKITKSFKNYFNMSYGK